MMVKAIGRLLTRCSFGLVVATFVACGSSPPAPAAPAAATPYDGPEAAATPVAAASPATEGGPALDMSLVGSGTGWNCFVMMGYLCYRDAAECNRVRSNIAAAQKEQGATPEDLALIGACQSKPVMWCHTIQTENGGLLWCGGGDDEEGKGQCLYHVEQLTGGEPKPGVSGCALLH